MKKSLGLLLILGYSFIYILNKVSLFLTRDLDSFIAELALSKEEAVVSPAQYTRWLYRKDILDLWTMMPDSESHKNFVMSEIAKYSEVMQDEKKDLYAGKFESGLLNFDEHIWDKMYKRVLVDAIVSHQFNIQHKKDLTFDEKIRTAHAY